jgi:hypothetical protein
MKYIKNTFELYTYGREWKQIKNLLGLNDEQLKEKVLQELQTYTWADVLNNILESNKTKDEVRTVRSRV